MAQPLPVVSFALVLEDGTIISRDVDHTDPKQRCYARSTTTPNVRPEHRAEGRFTHHFELHFSHVTNEHVPEVQA